MLLYIIIYLQLSNVFSLLPSKPLTSLYFFSSFYPPIFPLFFSSFYPPIFRLHNQKEVQNKMFDQGEREINWNLS